jgi:hypothetical protein
VEGKNVVIFSVDKEKNMLDSRRDKESLSSGGGRGMIGVEAAFGISTMRSGQPTRKVILIHKP